MIPKLKAGYELIIEDIENPGCNNGNYPEYRILFHGEVVKEGLTCGCGRGCANTDCISDRWGYHDTDIEEYRDDISDF